MTMNKEFKGVYAVAVTPFHKVGSFDFEAAKRHLDYLIESGVHGICILGATGEYQSVTLEEHKAYVREIVPYICDRTSVIVGVTRERADDVIDLILQVKESGGHAAMVLAPPYCHPTQEELVENYRYIMEKTEFPIMIYNNPGSCGITIERDTFRELFRLPYTAVVKESSGDIHKVTEVVDDAPESVSVFCGADNIAFESFAAGACGWISMLANVAPKDCAALYHAVYEEKNLEAGKEIYRRILPALDVLETFPRVPQTLKYLLSRKGFDCGYCRRPRVELTEEQKAYVVDAMHADNIE